MKYFYLIGLFIIGQIMFAQQSINVFFIGNSYTSTGNIPNLIQQIANSSGDELIYQTHTPGASTFQQHANNPNVISTIEQGNWDYVVLQEQSQLPSFPEEEFNNLVKPYAAQLSNLIKENNPCGQVAFYMTWGRKNGDSQNCPNWPPVCTYQGMDDLLYERYMSMAEWNQGIVSPVGAVWRYIRENYPEIELYSGDGSHPSANGSMAAAYTFYTVFFKKSPFDANFNGNIPPEIVNKIKTAVFQVVFNQMDLWHLWNYLPQADFSFTQSGTNVNFNDDSTIAESYLWDFGDGNTSELQNPIHNYAQPGTYQVKLTIENCENSDFIEKSIDLNGMNVLDFKANSVKIQPNPAQDFVEIIAEFEVKQIEIYSMDGKLIQSKIIQDQKQFPLQIRHLKSGIYMIRILTSKGIKQNQLIKD